MFKFIISAIITLLISILAAIHYRMGGSQYYNTKARDLGLNIQMNSLIVFLIFYNLFYFHWIWVYWFISIPLMLASLSCYWDFLNNGTKSWLTWTITGFFYGLSAIPFSLFTHKWIGFIIRTIIISVFIPLWAKFHPISIILFRTTWDGSQIEEFGRGFVTTITTPLLLI